MRAMRKWQLAVMALCLSAAMPALAKLQQRPVEWQLDGASYSGVLVYDDAGDARRPGVVMVPNWRGVNASAIDKAAQIAGDDYVVLVADVYGSQLRPKDNDEAAAAAQPLLKDRARLRARAEAALDALKAQAGTAPLDATRIAAVGFCFGGSTVLEMARASLPLAGVVSLHGGLASPMPAAADSGKVPMLVLNGAADRGVSAEDIAGSAARWTQPAPIGSSSTSAARCTASPNPTPTARRAACTTRARRSGRGRCWATSWKNAWAIERQP